MMPGINPRDLQRMMQQMGIKNEEIKAKRVVIEKEDGQIIITDPQVTLIEMKGQKSFQIAGKVEEKAVASGEDVELVMRSAVGISREDAEKALEESKGDIAQAILKLQK